MTFLPQPGSEFNGTWVFSELSGKKPGSQNHTIFCCLTLRECERLTVNQGVILAAGQRHASCTNNAVPSPPSVSSVLSSCFPVNDEGKKNRESKNL